MHPVAIDVPREAIMNKAAVSSLKFALAAFAAGALAGCSAGSGSGAAPPSAQVATASHQKEQAEKLLNASYYVILHDPALKAFVKSMAEPVVQANCVSCHGPELKGSRGVPNLVDEEWLWGTGSDEDTDETKVIQIQQTLLYGIRNQDCPDSTQKEHYGGCPDTRYSAMPAWGKVDLFTPAQIDELTEYVLSLSGQKVDKAAAARGKKNWKPCVECHGQSGHGYAPYGGPDLTDQLWLYGGDRKSVHDIIFNGAEGACPPWGKKLDAATIKALAVYIYAKSTENY
jgi:cytochrome c oxidase cbb3-type subunit 3